METSMEDEIYEAFKVFDEDQDNIVIFQELRSAVGKVGEKLSYLEIKELEKQTKKVAGVEEPEGGFDYMKFIDKMTAEPKKKKGEGKKEKKK